MKKLTLTILAAVCLAGLAMAAVRLTCMKFHEENVIRIPLGKDVVQETEDPELKADAVASYNFIIKSTEDMSMAQAKKWCLDIAESRCYMLCEDEGWEGSDGLLVFYYTGLLGDIYDIRGVDCKCYYAEGKITCLGLDAYPCLTRHGLRKKAFIVFEYGNGKKRYEFSRLIARRAKLLSGK